MAVSCMYIYARTSRPNRTDSTPSHILPPLPLPAVYVELLGQINLKKLRAQGVTVAEMLRFYVFLTEYIWRVLEPDEGEVRACMCMCAGGRGNGIE